MIETLSNLIPLGFAELKEFAGESMTFRSVAYTCVPSDVESGTTLVVGGLEDVIATTLAVDSATLLASDTALSNVGGALYYTSGATTKSVVGLTVTFRSGTFRILSADLDASGTTFMFRLGTPQR